MIPQIVRTVLFLAGGALVAFSQVEVSLQLPFAQQMPPQVAEWRENESLIRVVVQNTGRERYTGLMISAELQRDGRRIATTRNGHPAQPRFDLSPGEVRTLSWREVIAEPAIEYDRSITEQVLTTGELPAGNYQLCMQVLDARLRPIGRPGCGVITITLADPPILLSPIQGAQASVMPLLQWSPSSPSTPGLQYRVTLKIRYRGQTPAQAMASNPIRLQVDVPATSYQVPVTEQLGPDATDPNYAGHVWQVQALLNGRPYGRNRGLSQIEWFTVPPMAVDPKPSLLHGWAHAVARINLDEPNVPDTIRYVCDLPPGTPPDTVLVELEVEYPSSLSVSGGPISLQDRTGAILFGQLRPDSILIPIPVLAARGTSFYYAPDPKGGQQLSRYVYNGYYLYGIHPGDTLGLEGVYPGGYYLYGMHPVDTLGGVEYQAKWSGYVLNQAIASGAGRASGKTFGAAIRQAGPSGSGTRIVRGKIKLNEPVDIVGLRGGGILPLPKPSEIGIPDFRQAPSQSRPVIGHDTAGQTAQMRNWAHEVRKEISAHEVRKEIIGTGYRPKAVYGGMIHGSLTLAMTHRAQAQATTVYRWLMIRGSKPLRPEAQKYELELEIVKMNEDRPDER
jgi:hypothetical protein